MAISSPHRRPEPYPTITLPTPAQPRLGSPSIVADDKEKRNPCLMCHKAFDRPSTLKKHMLVHTGEKAHACPLCAHRFGVLSNLNRHMRICPQRQPPSADTSASSAPALSPPPPPLTTRSRRRVPDPDASSTRPRRRRRVPTPPTWIPQSLHNFDHTPYPKSVPVPLPPIYPGSHLIGGEQDERDSFSDEGEGAEMLYHPLGWRGRLPGPAAAVEMRMGISGISGGQVLVF
ncbi:hypothetical protein BC835DRAFT_1413881 [Cytidiella melzeri]|nr:hypothetical protein BC835DRAFT_1413881 [Cytidiella melzeri]